MPAPREIEGPPAPEPGPIAPDPVGWIARHLPPTTSRVAEGTPASINRRIAQATENNVRYYAAHREEIDARLAELDREWDIERSLQANAAVIGLGGTLLALFDRRFLAIPALVTGFLLLHAL